MIQGQEEYLTWSYTGFKTEADAEKWLAEAEVWFRKSKASWSDWTTSSSITIQPQSQMIKAVFFAEYTPQQ